MKGVECGWLGCGHGDCARVCTPDPPPLAEQELEPMGSE